MNDLLLDTDNDLIIDNNELSIGFSDYQHQQLILLMQKGELKESPLATVGIVNYLRESDIEGMLHEVRRCFVEDGMTVSKLNYNEQNGNLDFDATY